MKRVINHISNTCSRRIVENPVAWPPVDKNGLSARALSDRRNRQRGKEPRQASLAAQKGEGIAAHSGELGALDGGVGEESGKFFLREGGGTFGGEADNAGARCEFGKRRDFRLCVVGTDSGARVAAVEAAVEVGAVGKFAAVWRKYCYCRRSSGKRR